MTGVISTHVLDTARGVPAQGMRVRLEGPLRLAGTPRPTVEAATDADGRMSWTSPQGRRAGTYRLTFDTASYFAAASLECFYPEVVVTAALSDPDQDYHLPLLLSPFSYSTYRGT